MKKRTISLVLGSGGARGYANPDIYQGNELCAFNLVDPDNRRPVDYAYRQLTLQALMTAIDSVNNLPALLQELLDRIECGHAKLYLTWKTLNLRRQQTQLLRNGQYLSRNPRG